MDRTRDTPSPEGIGRRVLFVEDNVDVSRFSTQVVQDLGYETNWAANAEEALVRIGERGAEYDVVFSDVVMPDLPVVLARGCSHVSTEEGRVTSTCCTNRIRPSARRCRDCPSAVQVG